MGVFNTWDRIEDNELAVAVVDAMSGLFPDNPAGFFERTPHGYHDRATIARDLAAGGFTDTPEITTVTLRSRAKSARDAAIAFCQGSPLRNAIEAHDPAMLDGATDAATQVIARRFGAGAIDVKMQAIVVTIRK